MTMKEKLRQVRSTICINRREIAHTRLDAVAGTDNPYSLIMIFRRGHLAIKAGSVCHTMWASRRHSSFTQELHRGDTCAL
jgi:hypothetical protein